MFLFALDQTPRTACCLTGWAEARSERQAIFFQQVKSKARATACSSYDCRNQKDAEADAQGQGDEQAI